MNSTEDKIKWFCQKLFENIKFVFLTLSILLIGIGIVGIEALSKRISLPKEVLAFVLVGLVTQVILSIIDTLDQESKTKSQDKIKYYDAIGREVDYSPDKYKVVSRHDNWCNGKHEAFCYVEEKSDNPLRYTPIQEAIEKDKENLDQILDEDTSEDILTLANTISRINKHPTKDDLDNLEPDAPVVSTLTEDSTLESSDPKQNHQEVKQAHTEPTIGDALDIIKHHSDSMVVKQEGQQLTIKATLNQNNQNKNNQWGDF